ncbi:tyrosine-type recombinase/integrase [Balneolaceae bacterium YR4-1]|uniref:Tyrosine-type recombinase/integrase n=1 Tax=Halalkalibaculum roseum TaxID=2709311 RepID=A0A6M1SS21_9BACT|nr:tyrosine-type recombinase/integrase [Halalkalibaculum roseum]NGP75620.1 tyrosine-type recombinase/integrase [Halalkalibaculum roseum]
MAGLRKRKGIYYIRFFKKVDGKRKQKALSLGTKDKRQAQKFLLEFEDKFNRGEIDPFNGWTPQMEAEKKRKKLKGKYLPLDKAADQFVDLRSQANKTTKKNYRRHLEMLMDALGRTMPVTEIVEQDIRDFCFRSDISIATQASYLRHLKVFFRWLHEKEIIREDPTADIKPPKVPQKITQKTLTKEELEKVFEAFDVYYKELKKKGFATKPEQMRLWFKPMIMTTYFCGLRAKEAVNLTWKNVSLDEGFIRITNSDNSNTKSGKDRTLPLRDDLKPWLEQWHKDQGRPLDGYVFPSATGVNEWSQMDSLSLSKSFKKFAKLANLPDSINLHGLRHSCATDLLRKGVPITHVSKFLGHSSVTVTQIYEHLDENDLKNSINKYDK